MYKFLIGLSIVTTILSISAHAISHFGPNRPGDNRPGDFRDRDRDNRFNDNRPIFIPEGMHCGQPRFENRFGNMGGRGRFNGWFRRFGNPHPVNWPAWYRGQERNYYDFNWMQLRQVSCTSQVPGAFVQYTAYSQPWARMWGPEMVAWVENTALEECYRANNQNNDCIIVGCTPMY